MKKLRSLTLCFAIAFLVTSCQKEVQPPLQNDATPVRIISSNWVSAASMTWSDPTATPGAFVYANWNVPELTQDILDNSAVLIFAKTGASKSERLFPARINGTSNSNFDLYRSIAGQQSIELSHTKFSDGTYTAPTANSAVSFRYILLKNVPPANARIATGSMAGHNLDELKRMDYDAITALLGIGK
jgi:hypothetical protein